MTETERPPLDLARQAGQWLSDLAVEQGAGFRWPVALESPYAETSTASLSTGGAGIGRFLLGLHSETGEGRLRELAVGAARRITAWAPELYEATGPDLLDGAAGISRLLVGLVREGEPFEDDARRLGRWLLERGQAFRPTGFGYGRAGIGDALLELGRTLEDEEMLGGARETARWLLDVAHRPGHGHRAWGAAAGVETPDLTWGRGTTGVATFLMNLHAAEGDEGLLAGAHEALAWLASRAERPDDDQLAWSSRIETEPYEIAGRTVRCTGPCYGVAGVAEVFLKHWRSTGDEESARVAREGIAWVLGRAESTPGDGLRWPNAEGFGRYDSGLLAGTAGVGSTLLRFHEAYPEGGYGETAWRAARFLESVADEQPDGGLAWWDVLESTDAGEKRFHQTGLRSGAAGIATFFLLLHRSRELE